MMNGQFVIKFVIDESYLRMSNSHKKMQQSLKNFFMNIMSERSQLLRFLMRSRRSFQ